MNAQAVGALEALAYIKTRTKDTRTKHEIEKSIRLILEAQAKDFPLRYETF